MRDGGFVQTVPYLDIDSFEEITNPTDALNKGYISDGSYAKDKYGVYFAGKRISADPETFELRYFGSERGFQTVLGFDSPERNGEVNHGVFYQGERLRDLDGSNLKVAPEQSYIADNDTVFLYYSNCHSGTFIPGTFDEIDNHFPGC